MRVAAVELATSRGVRALTNRAIARRARLSPEEALEHYASVDDCLTGAYDEGCERMIAACMPALSGEGSWQDRLTAACEAAIAEFAPRPRLARFCMIEAWQVNLPLLSTQRLAARERSVALLAEYRRAGDSEAELPDLRFEMFAGATHHALREELEDPDCDAGTIRSRFDQLLDMFEPATVSTAA
jgi:AcrR family transcriptional regulator